MTTTNRGGGKRGHQLKGQARLNGLARARRWREEMRPFFDALDAAGCYSDSPPPFRQEWPIPAAT